MKKLLRLLSICALTVTFAGLLPQTAQAGPDRSQQVFTPVTTQTEFQALQPSQKVAITCPDCKAVIVKKVNKDKSNLSQFDCPVCKHSFEVTTSPGGKTQIPKLVCRDSKGHTMSLHLCAMNQ